jgi:hypothetical protein
MSYWIKMEIAIVVDKIWLYRMALVFVPTVMCKMDAEVVKSTAGVMNFNLWGCVLSVQ